VQDSAHTKICTYNLHIQIWYPIHPTNMPDWNLEILEEKIRLLSSEIRSEFKQLCDDLRDDGWVLRKNSDAEREADAKDDDVEIEREAPDDVSATSVGSKKKKNKKKKRAAKKAVMGKKMFGVGGWALAIALVVLCIAGLLVASKSGEDGSRRLKGKAFEVTDAPSASIVEGAIKTQDGSVFSPPSPLPSLETSEPSSASADAVVDSQLTDTPATSHSPTETGASTQIDAIVPTTTSPSSSVETALSVLPTLSVDGEADACPDGLKAVGKYPGCCVEYPEFIGNGWCDWGAYNTKECRYDGGDCEPPIIIDGYPACSYGLHQVEGYTGCCVEVPEYIGDGYCSGGIYMTEECGYDGGDCEPPIIIDGYPLCSYGLHQVTFSPEKSLIPP
jgi:hypothetical protein